MGMKTPLRSLSSYARPHTLNFMDEDLEWPDFVLAARLLVRWPWESKALDDIGEFEDGPRTLRDWFVLWETVAAEHHARLVQLVDDILSTHRSTQTGKSS